VVARDSDRSDLMEGPQARDAVAVNTSFLPFEARYVELIPVEKTNKKALSWELLAPCPFSRIPIQKRIIFFLLFVSLCIDSKFERNTLQQYPKNRNNK
jgi:hypothetical protein